MTDTRFETRTTPVDQVMNTRVKRLTHAALCAIVDASPDSVSEALSQIYANDSEWRGSHPLNEMEGIDAVAANVWQPLLRAFPDLERRDDLFVAGLYEDRHYVAACGHYLGTFKQDWLGIPATGQPVFIRYGEVHEVRDGKIVQSTCLWDVLDVMRQAGYWPLPPSWGMEGRWPGPITADGLLLTDQDNDEGQAAIRQTLAMHKSLADYNDHDMAGRDGLLAMPQRDHWHEKMMWYGPSGIGTNRGLAGFVDFHQLPFRLTFPNRQGGAQIEDRATGGHYVRIGDGHYSVTGGWPSVVANHLGGGLLGSGPTGNQITMRVMDFYNHHEGRIRENWVPIDIIHVLLQMDVDVMARMRDQFGRDRLGLRS